MHHYTICPVYHPPLRDVLHTRRVTHTSFGTHELEQKYQRALCILLGGCSIS